MSKGTSPSFRNSLPTNSSKTSMTHASLPVSASKSAQSLTSLYLKQFFNNFITKQENINSINLLISSLQVLDELVNKFSQDHSINFQNGIINRNKNRSIKQTDYQFIVEGIYHKIKRVFEWVEQQFAKQAKPETCQCQLRKDSSVSSISISNMNQSDEQLYQILSQYKNQNKKFKQSVANLTKKLDNKNNQFMELKVAKEICDKQIIYLNSRVSQLQLQISELTDKLSSTSQMLTNKKKQNGNFQAKLASMQAQITEINKQNEKARQNCQQLQKKYKDALDQNKVLASKIEKMGSEQAAMIRSKMQQIPRLIQEKLGDTKYWNKASLQALKKYVSYSRDFKNGEKQNMRINHNVQK